MKLKFHVSLRDCENGEQLKITGPDGEPIEPTTEGIRLDNVKIGDTVTFQIVGEKKAKKVKKENVDDGANQV